MWIRGEDSDGAQAAAILTAELLIRMRHYLEAKAKRRR
jgi:hypothetical protein